ncbi:MAG: phosphonate metabolism protein/1,5-bisphosphokinase (PRPP-forming) PhnN [Bacteroidota bacterium]
MKRGKLFYVVGASGAGKDTLMAFAQESLTNHPVGRHPVKFAQRYITRPASVGGEDHIPVSREDFRRMQADQQFPLWWGSHGNLYGIHQEIDQWMNEGYAVVVNGSRGYHATAEERYPEMITVSIEVSEAVLRARLHQRGRESEAEIEQRVARSQQFTDFTATHLVSIQNDQPLEISGNAFVAAILRLIASPSDK